MLLSVAVRWLASASIGQKTKDSQLHRHDAAARQHEDKKTCCPDGVCSDTWFSCRQPASLPELWHSLRSGAAVGLRGMAPSLEERTLKAILIDYEAQYYSRATVMYWEAHAGKHWRSCQTQHTSLSRRTSMRKPTHATQPWVYSREAHVLCPSARSWRGTRAAAGPCRQRWWWRCCRCGTRGWRRPRCQRSPASDPAPPAITS